VSPAEWQAFGLSLQVALLATLITLPLGAAAGRWLARARFRGRGLVESVLMLPLVIPPVVTGFALLALLSPVSPLGSLLAAAGVRFVLAFPGAVLAAAAVSFPLQVMASRAAFEAVDPRLEEAARSLGAGWWRTFRKVSLPLARGGLTAGALLAFARALGEFGATIVLAGNIVGRTRTLPLAVYTEVAAGRGTDAWRLALLSALLGIAATWGAGRLAGVWKGRRRA
jgi:molybdate transport system permease protein